MAVEQSAIHFARTTMSKWYAIDTKDLQQLNVRAITNGYNRAINESAIEKLDRRGIHMITLVMTDHTNVEGKFSTRAMLYMKYKNSQKPETGFIDVSHLDWKVLVKDLQPLNP
jgi:hypothetical protein